MRFKPHTDDITGMIIIYRMRKPSKVDYWRVLSRIERERTHWKATVTYNMKGPFIYRLHVKPKKYGEWAEKLADTHATLWNDRGKPKIGRQSMWTAVLKNYGVKVI